MKEIFTQYAAYNVWANTQFADIIRSITPSYTDREIESSFPSIRATVNHIRSAEHIWLCRIKDEPITSWPQYDEYESNNDLADAWLKGSKQILSFAEQLTYEQFAQEYAYKDMKGNTHTDVLSNIFMHLFNHSSFHRGQLVTLFRQSGISTIPRSDYIVYARELKV